MTTAYRIYFGEDAESPIFVQDDEPAVPGPWVWIKTSVDPPELWVEDGLVE